MGELKQNIKLHKGDLLTEVSREIDKAKLTIIWVFIVLMLPTCIALFNLLFITDK
jgi:hypothetical protein